MLILRGFCSVGSNAFLPFEQYYKFIPCRQNSSWYLCTSTRAHINSDIRNIKKVIVIEREKEKLICIGQFLRARLLLVTLHTIAFNSQNQNPVKSTYYYPNFIGAKPKLREVRYLSKGHRTDNNIHIMARETVSFTDCSRNTVEHGTRRKQQGKFTLVVFEGHTPCNTHIIL